MNISEICLALDLWLKEHQLHTGDFFIAARGPVAKKYLDAALKQEFKDLYQHPISGRLGLSAPTSVNGIEFHIAWPQK